MNNGHIRLPKNILTIIISIIVLIGIFVGWGIKYAQMDSKLDIATKKIEIMEATRLEWVKTIHEIETHLEVMSNELKNYNKRLEKLEK